MSVASLRLDGGGDLSPQEALGGIKVEFSAIRESIAIVGKGGIAHHFRTTTVPEVLGGADIPGICDLLPPGSSHIQRLYRPVSTVTAAMATGAP